ncbi:MAG: hypothetical protein A2790_10785 [Phenylobacterium sp. RIFCSPHIGHO2_01_FULL_69_31]|uniref:asparagine synthase-related protein n=1 Tax=Phenylobacterium sp. RIFCSPHIGHO2_01_FULL_69_31 TaxID=1801944 RepID=UPI0008AB92FD|nr:asparagine synthase C-terminal domain-containing protein [Phenylobacterium sp. RIFCSPHIGHO2_01_FULL_69_31]OHB31127.1 MAG: hypothetical protein A2790_10785 [Phenylobacterium sp. RIFCSPHIGHO2_01_FULL_69_31]
MRRAYVILAHPPNSELAARRSALLAAELDASACWRRAGDGAGFQVWTDVNTSLPVRSLAGEAGLVIGDLYNMPDPDPQSSPLFNPACARGNAVTARRLLRGHWGQYVAVLNDGRQTALLRDPSGMLDALTWSLGDDVSVAASDPWRLPAVLRPRRPYLNWSRIAAFLTVPTVTTTPPLFDDMVSVGPGELQPLTSGGGAAEPLWTPLRFADDLLSAKDAEAASAHLLERVDRCVASLLADHAGALVELSGGLDSSSLAAAIGAVGLNDRVRSWLNLVDIRREGDEAIYAQAVADRLGVTLTRVERAPGQITVEDLAELATEPWPAIAGVDAARDRDEVARLSATGATAIVSGQGGDAVFFQMGAPVVLADALAAQGLGALAGPVLPDIARRTHQSVWGLLRQVEQAWRGRLPERKVVNALVAPEVRRWAGGAEHAWTAEALASTLPLGKRLQVRAIAASHFNHQYSRRRRVADLLYPLLAQPVVELALRIPTYVLAGGAYDRPFQRAVFADRLPAVVARRRSKGSASVYFARLMANSLADLRPYLLDGCLCSAGLLDRDRLDAAMTAEHLIWKETANDLITSLATESWVRYWQTRAPDSLAAGRR